MVLSFVVFCFFIFYLSVRGLGRVFDNAYFKECLSFEFERYKKAFRQAYTENSPRVTDDKGREIVFTNGRRGDSNRYENYRRTGQF